MRRNRFVVASGLTLVAALCVTLAAQSAPAEWTALTTNLTRAADNGNLASRLPMARRRRPHACGGTPRVRR